MFNSLVIGREKMYLENVAGRTTPYFNTIIQRAYTNNCDGEQGAIIFFNKTTSNSLQIGHFD